MSYFKGWDPCLSCLCLKAGTPYLSCLCLKAVTPISFVFEGSDPYLVCVWRQWPLSQEVERKGSVANTTLTPYLCVKVSMSLLCVCVCVCVCSWYVYSVFLFFSFSCILYLCKNPVGSQVYFACLQFQEKAHQSSWSTQTSWCATARSKVIINTSAAWCFTPSRQHFCSVSLLNMYCVQLVSSVHIVFS